MEDLKVQVEAKNLNDLIVLLGKTLKNAEELQKNLEKVSEFELDITQKSV